MSPRKDVWSGDPSGTGSWVYARWACAFSAHSQALPELSQLPSRTPHRPSGLVRPLPKHCSTLSPYPAALWHPGSRVKAAQRRSLRREALTRLSGCHIFAYGDEVEAVSRIASELQTTVAIKIAYPSLQCNAAG